MQLDENNTVVMLYYRVVAASDGLVNVNFVIESSQICSTYVAKSQWVFGNNLVATAQLSLWNEYDIDDRSLLCPLNQIVGYVSSCQQWHDLLLFCPSLSLL